MKVQKVMALAILISLALTTGFAQSPAHLDSAWVRPPLEPKTVALQLAAGTVGGIAGFVGVALPFFLTGDGGGPWGSGAGMMGLMLGTGIGIPLGSTIGVFAAGHRDSTSGSLWATGIGSLVGLFIFGTATVELGLSSYLLPLTAAAGATITFNLTRHYRRRPATEH